MPEPVHETREGPPDAEARATGEEAAHGRLALARLAELEQELAMARRHQEAKVAELEQRLGWFEENELDFRAAAERRPWIGSLLRRWSSSVKLVRRCSRYLHRR